MVAVPTPVPRPPRADAALRRGGARACSEAQILDGWARPETHSLVLCGEECRSVQNPVVNVRGGAGHLELAERCRSAVIKVERHTQHGRRSRHVSGGMASRHPLDGARRSGRQVRRVRSDLHQHTALDGGTLNAEALEQAAVGRRPGRGEARPQCEGLERHAQPAAAGPARVLTKFTFT